MVSGDVTQFHKQLGVIPSHKELFGREATHSDLTELLHKYRVAEWLSFLARMQNMLGADKVGDIQHMQHVLGGTVSPQVHKKFKEFEARIAGGAQLGLYYERQMSTLQQLAVLYAPETGTASLDSDDGRHDLSLALLMTMDLMNAGRPHSSDVQSLLPVVIQEQARMATIPAPVYAARALHFYELDRSERSVPVSKYLELFEEATETSAVNCILGGLAIMIHEDTRELKEIAHGWNAIPRSHKCENPKEAEVLAAYESVRMRSLSELRDLIRDRERNRPIRDWNLIALSQAPICDMGDIGAFVLNHTVLGRSLFDSVRHAILTAALEKRLPKPFNDRRAIGDLYGNVFESYIFSLFDASFPGQVYRIPEHTEQQRSDLLIWFPDKVVVVEIKGVHFVGLHHASFLSIEDRRNELQGIGMENAVNQLIATVRAIRNGDIAAPSMPSYDWTTTHIVPVIVTEEQMPWVPGCWEAFYRSICEPLHGPRGAGPVAKLRILTVNDVERLPDQDLQHDFATMLARWAADESLMELTWPNYLLTEEVGIRSEFVPGRFTETLKFLARRLDLDDSQITIPDAQKE